MSFDNRLHVHGPIRTVPDTHAVKIAIYMSTVTLEPKIFSEKCQLLREGEDDWGSFRWPPTDLLSTFYVALSELHHGAFPSFLFA